MTQFEPRDVDFRERVAASFGRQSVMDTLGIRMSRLEPGEVELTMPFDQRFAQQHGFIHAGIITTGLDSACGYAAFTLMSDDAAVLTVEFKTNLLAPAKGASFRFVGRVVKPGRTLTVCDGRAYAVQDASETLVASMSGTLMAVYARSGIDH